MALNGLARRLVRDGVLSEHDAQRAMQDCARDKTPFVSWLVAKGISKGQQIAEAASREFGIPLLDINAFDPALIPEQLVASKLIQQHHALPLYQRGKNLFVAVSDPTNLNALSEIQFHTGMKTHAILVEDGALNEKIEQLLEKAEDSLDNQLGTLDDAGLEELSFESDEAPNEEEEENVDDAPVVRFVNKVLLDAIKGGASDIHFEPYEKNYRVRFRTDGVLHEIARPPVNIGSRLAARLKVMSQMDISERRLPQDGRIKMKLSHKRSIDFRVNTLPTLWGEKIVLRILDPSSTQMSIEDLGYEPAQKDLFEQALQRPQGMILVTGPTGSGKTVSLYTGLNILNTEERNISTAEDPVEINLEGINQVHVNARVGLTFAEALRSFLRQDPDVIMVGEIRDLETAEIAVKASQTGHLVMSTLHTNSATETLTRLLNMGVPAFNVATSVKLIIAQRLVRKLCTHCATPAEIPEDVLRSEGMTDSQISSARLFSPVGCDKCHEGYRGRIGIYEVVSVTEKISRIILGGGNAMELEQSAREEGFPNLRSAALKKCAAGITSLEEVNRITGD